MKFLLLINGDETLLNREPEPGTPPINPEFVAYTDAMVKAGAWLGGDRLKTTRHGARVRVRDGKSVVLDGPYADSKEQLGGYYLIRAANLAEAQTWAAKCPGAIWGHIEIREVSFADD